MEWSLKLDKQIPNSQLLIEFDTSLTANFRPIVDKPVIDPMNESTDLGNGWKSNPGLAFTGNLNHPIGLTTNV